MSTADCWIEVRGNEDILGNYISACIGLIGCEIYGITTIANENWLAFRGHINSNGQIRWGYQDIDIPRIIIDKQAIDYFSSISGEYIDQQVISDNTVYWDEFDEEIFLKEEQWLTYIEEGMPVRYIRKDKNNLCNICGLLATKDNPLQNAHIIPFQHGVRRFGLRPKFLNHHLNIITAHRKICNRKAELNDNQIESFLFSRGLVIPDYIRSQYA